MIVEIATIDSNTNLNEGKIDAEIPSIVGTNPFPYLIIVTANIMKKLCVVNNDFPQWLN
ncbi:MAG: hypothetical protein ACRD47_10150 [Nitrososphaeraceae archaeon]